MQDFMLGGANLKSLRRAKGGAKIFGVFRVKNHDFMQKNRPCVGLVQSGHPLVIM